MPKHTGTHHTFPGHKQTGKTTPTGPGDEMGASVPGSSGLGPSVPGSSGFGPSVESTVPTGGDRKAMTEGEMWKDASKKGNVSQGFPVMKKP